MIKTVDDACETDPATTECRMDRVCALSGAGLPQDGECPICSCTAGYGGEGCLGEVVKSFTDIGGAYYPITEFFKNLSLHRY